MSDLNYATRYLHCVYLTACIMGSSIFGDALPLTCLEQLFACILTAISKVFLAFLYAEVSNLLSSFYHARVEHLKTSNEILEWLRIKNIPPTLIGRVMKYRNILWRRFKGIDDQSLISTMPVTLQSLTRHLILEKILLAEIIPKDEQGAITAIINKLIIKVYPKGEFIIVEGEIATDMFFIIEGIVNVYNINGVKVKKLGEGKCFGEKEILTSDKKLRSESVYCATDVSVAILNKAAVQSFSLEYPMLYEQLLETVKKKSADDEQKCTEKAVRKDSSNSPMTDIKKSKKELNALGATIEARIYSERTAQGSIWEDSRFNIKKIFITLAESFLCIYNIIFIPLQMAFRIEYNALFYTIESIVLVFHLFDILALVSKYRKYDNITYAENDEEPIEPQKISAELARKKKTSILWSISFECLTFLPWSIVLQNIYYPTFVIAFVKMIRLFKVWPMVKLMTCLKTVWLKQLRIIEVIFYYFLVAHIGSCLLILMIYIPPTKNDSWVKRLPFPETMLYGGRTGNDMGNVTHSDIYVAAIYYMYITISHVSIGDVCAVNIDERILATIYVAVAVFIYVFLFANVTSMVTDLARTPHASLDSRYQRLMALIKSEQLPKGLINRINEYFNFLWLGSKGMDEEFLKGLPDTIRIDIYFAIYNIALENCYMCKGNDMKFQNRIAASILKLGSLRKYMKGDIILKAGSCSKKTYILLDGELALVCVPNKKIGLIKPGLFFSRIQGETERSPVYVVSTQLSTLCVIDEENMVSLVKLYPTLKSNFKFINKIIDCYCQEKLSEYIKSINTRYNPDKLLENVCNCLIF